MGRWERVVRPRRIRFEYPANTNPMWTPRRPEFSCAANSVSLMMPAIEPYFIRSVRRGWAGSAVDADLGPTVEAYLTQEGQHFGQHLVFNRFLFDRYRGVERLEGWIRATYRWLESSRSAEFSLAFAASSEMMAYSAARWAASRRHELFDGADEVTSSLFLWHLAEEVEHKSVAHDVYRAAVARSVRSTAVYLGAMAVALALVMVFVFAGTTVMLAAERRLWNPVSWIRLTWWAMWFAFELLTNLALSVFPSFHPTQLVDPAFYLNWLDEYDLGSATLPLWFASSQGTPSTAAQAASASVANRPSLKPPTAVHRPPSSGSERKCSNP